MHRPYYRLLLLALLLWTCSTPEKPTAAAGKSTKAPSRYLRWVGDSKYDANLDDSTFQLCYGEYDVKQYFNMSNGLLYQGEKKALEGVFHSQYETVPVDQSGWIRIRFIVNCDGETGRFRLIASDEDYQPMHYDARITDQLTDLTRQLNGWLPQHDKGRSVDYYQYLIFKIKKGQLTDILP